MRIIIDTERDSMEEMEEAIAYIQGRLQSRGQPVVVANDTQPAQESIVEQKPAEQKATDQKAEFTDITHVVGKDLFGNDIQEEEEDHPIIEIVKYDF
ncbi:MAG: hypothetical protein V1735_03030 [Nanoarchaeota archaeon]